MRKFLLCLLITVISFMMTSCGAYIQGYIDDMDVTYEWSYNGWPVRYVNGVAYYYVDWRWRVLPESYYGYVRHHPYPMRQGRPYITYPNKRSNGPHVQRHGRGGRRGGR